MTARTDELEGGDPLALDPDPYETNIDAAVHACVSAFVQPEAVMPDPLDPKDLDVATRERLGELTLALAEDVFALGDPYLDAIMRDLMLRIGRVIAWNLQHP